MAKKDDGFPAALKAYRPLVELLLPKCCGSAGPQPLGDGDPGTSGPPPKLARHLLGDGDPGTGLGGGPPAKLMRPVDAGNITNEGRSSVVIATAGVVALTGLKQAAEQVSDARLKAKMLAAYERALVKAIDDFCGNTPHWPPKAQSDVEALIGSLAVTAATYSDKSFRAALLSVAGQIAGKAFSAQDKAPAAAKKGKPKAKS